MEAFRWTPNFVTGLSEVDDQHRGLVNVINRFGELVMRQQTAAADELEAVFGELTRYAQYHFFEEESLMLGKHLDMRHITLHQQAHRSFLDEVTLLHGGISASNRDAAKSLLQFLTHW
ncbi:MAG: hemerythrin family protein, partial [Proteobacteria bacterium]|nr:hemerythrin family protein [Pseudomonadota bacterium]